MRRHEYPVLFTRTCQSAPDQPSICARPRLLQTGLCLRNKSHYLSAVLIGTGTDGTQTISRGGGRSSGGAAFASINHWPRQGVHGQVHLRLSRPRNPRARVTLSIGERRFELVAGEVDAWAPDARTDAAIVAAIRSSRSMSVEALARGGGAFADAYTLRGAATAIDAAALGCLRAL